MKKSLTIILILLSSPAYASDLLTRALMKYEQRLHDDANMPNLIEEVKQALADESSVVLDLSSHRAFYLSESHFDPLPPKLPDRIISIDFSSNYISASNISYGLLKLTDNIKEIDLSHNFIGIGSIGLNSIDILIQNMPPHIERLYLDQNLIDDDGLKLLVSGIPSCLSLLFLDRNRFSNEGTKCLRDAGFYRFKGNIWQRVIFYV